MSSSKLTLLVIDNFYENPYEVREFALKQQYFESKLPFKRTKSFATQEHFIFFQTLLQPFAGNITMFDSKNDDYNGSFQYSTYNDWGFYHYDPVDWAAVIYLSPDAPTDYGTSLYQYEDGTYCRQQLRDEAHEETLTKHKYDVTKWKETDRVGNLFNRMILYNAKLYHRPTNLFGSSIEDGRLIQVFCFDTEIHN